jgi:hypothetical protein
VKLNIPKNAKVRRTQPTSLSIFRVYCTCKWLLLSVLYGFQTRATECKIAYLVEKDSHAIVSGSIWMLNSMIHKICDLELILYIKGLVWTNIHSTDQSNPCPIMSADNLPVTNNQNPSPILQA